MKNAGVTSPAFSFPIGGPTRTRTWDLWIHDPSDSWSIRRFPIGVDYLTTRSEASSPPMGAGRFNLSLRTLEPPVRDSVLR